MTGARRTRRKVTLIAGGIGIAPMRALMESTSAGPGELVLLYRAGRREDLVFKAELDLLAEQRKATVRYLVGHRRKMGLDPLGPETIGRLVPDIADHDVYLCGPNGMMDVAEHSLWVLGVPRSHVHAERFSY
jgi:ferredoxin-NADP reductase